MGWLAFVALLVVFAGTLFWVRRRMSEEIARIEGAHHRQVAQLTDEADARTARVERASLAEAERRGVALAEDLLPVADALQAAVEIDDLASPREVRNGVELARRELGRAFQAHGIDAISPDVGDPFNPVLHEAVEKLGDGNAVVRVHRVGWRHDDRVLRSALVGVGRVESSATDAVIDSEHDAEAVVELSEKKRLET